MLFYNDPKGVNVVSSGGCRMEIIMLSIDQAFFHDSKKHANIPPISAFKRGASFRNLKDRPFFRFIRKVFIALAFTKENFCENYKEKFRK